MKKVSNPNAKGTQNRQAATGPLPDSPAILTAAACPHSTYGQGDAKHKEREFKHTAHNRDANVARCAHKYRALPHGRRRAAQCGSRATRARRSGAGAGKRKVPAAADPTRSTPLRGGDVHVLQCGAGGAQAGHRGLVQPAEVLHVQLTQRGAAGAQHGHQGVDGDALAGLGRGKGGGRGLRRGAGSVWGGGELAVGRWVG